MISRRPTRQHRVRLTAVVLVGTLFAAGCSSSSSGTRAVGADSNGSSATTEASGTSASAPVSTTDSTDASAATLPPLEAPTTMPVVALEPVDVPAPPAPFDATAVAPADLAQTLADATAPDLDGNQAAWITAYGLAGVPVLDPSGAPLGSTGDDPVGPQWWQLWMSTIAHAGQGVSLADALKIVITPDDRAPTDDEANDAAVAFVTDIATGATSADPTAAFAANFIVAKLSQNNSRTNLLDPTVDLADTRVDTATAFFIGWLGLRQFGAHLAATTEPSGFTATGPAGSSRAPLSAPGPVAGSSGCDASSSDSQAGQWATWVINQIANGVGLGNGVELTGLVEKVALLNPHLITKKQFDKFTSWARRANALAAVASLLAQYRSIESSGGVGDVLDRTRTVVDGQTTDLRFDLFFDPEKSVTDERTKKALCALNFLSTLTGVSLDLPEAGPLSGVVVEFTGGVGFGERVLFNDYQQLRQDADDGGSVRLGIRGKGQKKELPESTPRVSKEYSVLVEATPAPVDGESIFNTFFDSFTGVGSGPLGPVGAAVDIVKTTRWDVGEYFMPMMDWQPQAFAINGTEEDVTFTGVVCDLGAPFSAVGSGVGVTVQMTFTPTSADAGSWSYVGSGSGVSVSGLGGYTVTLTDAGGTLDMYGEGEAGGNTRGWENPLTLTPTEAER